MQHSMRILAAKDSIFRRVAETDEEFWARMEREYPGQQNTDRHLVSPDQAGQSFEYGEPGVDFSDDEEHEIPERMSLRDHSKLLNSGTFEWDGDLRYPKYTHIIHRDIVDSDGVRGHGMEGHVIEHNTHNRGPALPTEDYEPSALEYPWTHTYYPAGLRDEEGLVKGYNTVDGAMHAAHQIGLLGARHPDSQRLLHSGYRYVGSEEPYDSSIQLPHEMAQERR